LDQQVQTTQPFLVMVEIVKRTNMIPITQMWGLKLIHINFIYTYLPYLLVVLIYIRGFNGWNFRLVLKKFWFFH